MRPQKPCRQPHGTVTRYVAGCSCLDCCEAHADYARESRYGRSGYKPLNLAPDSVREHISNLGLGVCEIARRAGVSRTTVRAIAAGRYGSVKRETAAAILGVDGGCR